MSVIVYGTGGHSRVVAEIAELAGYHVLMCTDDLTQCNKYPVALGVGSNDLRRQVFSELADVVSIVHPSAIVSSRAVLGRGVVVCAGAIVQPGAIIGDGVLINTGATVDHDCIIGAFTHISPGCHLGGTVMVGDGTHLGIGASVKNNVTIGARSVIGAGAAVVSDIGSDVVAVGVPAKVRGRV